MTHAASQLFDPNDLETLRAQVVLPVLTAMLRDGELREYQLGWVNWQADLDTVGPERTAEADCLYVVVVPQVPENRLHHCLWRPGTSYENLAQAAYQFAWVMEEWIPEFVAWGEQRLMPDHLKL
ncbi:hypothetical protein [Kineosporia babensis]|uniref:Uncharacterized protein n=1 Tax=Kineosporia babensis TaxID=499548 RepID=A0A9X1NLC4_9ACTN|nr:hypothetical protein [Kineosporia babensis]MCD5316440.1 hypothetical protein [Kineosporia babensis]